MTPGSQEVMEQDFDTWYGDLRPRMAAALAAWCGDRGLAAEAVDEAFVRAIERWDRVSVMTSPSGWVWRTATNLVRRRVGRRKLERRRIDDGSVPAAGPVAGPDGDSVDLVRALGALADRQRTAVVLHYVADLPVVEVAVAMGIAPGTVSATLHHARAHLARTLADATTGARTGANTSTGPAIRPDGAPT